MTTPEIVRWVIDSFEGRLYTDSPVDNGGATKFGITLRTLRYYRRLVTGDAALAVSKADVQALTVDEAVACGVRVFAAEPSIDRIADWRTRLMVYDYGFHSGQPRAIKALQASLGLQAQDGVLGPITLELAAAVGEPLLVALRVLTAREEFMQDLMRTPSQRTWLLGWWKRTTRLQRVLTT